MPEEITNAQHTQLELMRGASFNNFDGHKVVLDLLDHLDLWESALMDVSGYTLSDLPDDEFNVDTLMVRIPRNKIKGFLKIAKAWKADVCEPAIFDLEDQRTWRFGASDMAPFAIYRLWWD